MLGTVDDVNRPNAEGRRLGTAHGNDCRNIE
jgi:hypothetical protein